MALDFGDLMVG